MRRTTSSTGSTAAVLWLMILLVFLPIAIGHVVARHSSESGARAGTLPEQTDTRAG